MASQSRAVAAPPPGAQGPGPMPSAAVDALDLALVRRTAGMLPGEHRGLGVGIGTELARVVDLGGQDAVTRAERRERLQETLRRAGARHVALDTSADWLLALGRGLA